MAQEDPFEVFGVSPDADDATIRRAYLRLLRLHPPERDPDGFRRIRAAFEAVRSQQDRAARRLLARPILPDVEEVLRGMAQEPIPKDPKSIVAALRAAILRTLPELTVRESEMRPIPDRLPEEVRTPSGSSADGRGSRR